HARLDRRRGHLSHSAAAAFGAGDGSRGGGHQCDRPAPGQHRPVARTGRDRRTGRAAIRCRPSSDQVRTGCAAVRVVTMCAAIATWLLLRALADGRWRWWAGYEVAIAATGLFNVLALLLLASHGTTVWVARTTQRT